MLVGSLGPPVLSFPANEEASGKHGSQPLGKASRGWSLGREPRDTDRAEDRETGLGELSSLGVGPVRTGESCWILSCLSCSPAWLSEQQQQ